MAKLEDDFKKLEDIIERMEHEDLSLEDSFKAYEEGMRIVLSCNEQIDKVEKQLIILNEKNRRTAMSNETNYIEEVIRKYIPCGCTYSR